MVCKTCKLLVAGRCISLDLPVGNLDPACEKYDGPQYEGRYMHKTNPDGTYEDDEDDGVSDDSGYEDDEDWDGDDIDWGDEDDGVGWDDDDDDDDDDAVTTPVKLEDQEIVLGRSLLKRPEFGDWVYDDPA
jgi:hypothetical protein